jgi:hypothetical protein
MKRLLFVCAVCLLALPLVAQNSGPSATGTFSFGTPAGKQTVSFDARNLAGGRTVGQIALSGPAEIPDQDVDGDGQADIGGTISNLSITVTVDCLAVRGNRAVLSGPITASSLIHYVGRRALLAVEDNGEGVNATRDRFTWGLYRQHAKNWTPSDAELPFDNGASLTWTATDFERPDDAGIPARQSESIDCHSFALSAYALDEVKHGDGNVQVRP